MGGNEAVTEAPDTLVGLGPPAPPEEIEDSHRPGGDSALRLAETLAEDEPLVDEDGPARDSEIPAHRSSWDGVTPSRSRALVAGAAAHVPGKESQLPTWQRLFAFAHPRRKGNAAAKFRDRERELAHFEDREWFEARALEKPLLRQALLVPGAIVLAAAIGFGAAHFRSVEPAGVHAVGERAPVRARHVATTSMVTGVWALRPGSSAVEEPAVEEERLGQLPELLRRPEKHKKTRSAGSDARGDTPAASSAVPSVPSAPSAGEVKPDEARIEEVANTVQLAEEPAEPRAPRVPDVAQFGATLAPAQ